jgi:thiosulfate/3-mercaptopyruvate sulfurtransferase
LLSLFACLQLITTSLPGLAHAQHASGDPKSDSGTDSKQLLIAAEQLAENLERFFVVDCRNRQAFEEGHIDGSRWLDANQWKNSSLADGGLFDQELWNEQVQNLGIDNTKPTVVIGDSITTTARIWWLLSYFGLRDVRLVDGDFAAWKGSGLPTTNESTAVEPSDFTVEFQKAKLATIEEVTLVANGDANSRILDNRSAREFTGGPDSEGGHIPDAVHLEWTDFLDEDGRFLPPEKIQSLLKERNLEVEDSIVAHCRTGARCSVAVFALELAGGKDIKNYYRGWSEYAVQKNLPVAQ